MTDEEFQSILDQVSREEEDAAGMAEGLDLASKAVGSESPGKPMVDQTDTPTQSVGERESDKQAEPEPEVPVVESEVARPTDTKTKVTRRKLEMKDDPKAKKVKPSRVSQRCLGRWAAKRAGSNTASEAVDISSEEEDEVPSNSGEDTPPATHAEAQVEGRREVSPSPTAQEEIPSNLTAQEETPVEEEPIQTQVTESPGQEEPSTEAQRSPDQEEERYSWKGKGRGKPLHKRSNQPRKPEQPKQG